MKRGREEEAPELGDDAAPAQDAAPASDSKRAKADTADKNGDSAAQPLEEEDEDDKPLFHNYRMSKAVRKGAECPYLDTISRQNLDFDFEKCCSVSLSPVNVYACLVCGKYFQGRGPGTHAYTHALDTRHHMYMKTETGRVYCLPDQYEVQDRSLADIQYVLDPRFTPAEVSKLDSAVTWARALEGIEYMPGLVGLNNMRMNDYANVVIQLVMRIVPIRDFFLVPGNYAGVDSPLVRRLGELVRKAWNPRAFKGQVSPHEFMQAVIAASKKRFTIEAQADPSEFLPWLLNCLHADLTGGRRKRRSVITDALQGELEVTTEPGTGKAKDCTEPLVERVPFLLLGLDLPPAPLFKDAMEKVTIPQVPVFDLLRKYDGVTVTEDIKLGRRRIRPTKLPPYLALAVKRFSRNQFFAEKNPTIVNFPVRNLELAGVVPVPPGPSGEPGQAKYDLVASIAHEGRAGAGSYRAYVHRKSEDTWYEVQDLRVSEVLPQMVALSEAYIQVYERKKA